MVNWHFVGDWAVKKFCDISHAPEYMSDIPKELWLKIPLENRQKITDYNKNAVRKQFSWLSWAVVFTIVSLILIKIANFFLR